MGLTREHARKVGVAADADMVVILTITAGGTVRSTRWAAKPDLLARVIAYDSTAADAVRDEMSYEAADHDEGSR